MLNSVESFVIVEDEEIFVLLLLGDILENALRVVGPEEGLVVFDGGWGWGWRIILASFGEDGKIVVVSGLVGIIHLSENVQLMIVKYRILLIHTYFPTTTIINGFPYQRIMHS